MVMPPNYLLEWLAPSVALAALSLVFAVLAADAQTPSRNAAEAGNCDAPKTARPATPTESGAASGVKNMGATGWSGGGLGGSHNETSNSGPSPDSRTAQPETASGLDPTNPDQNRNDRADRCEEK